MAHRLANKAQAAKGRIKETAGKTTGDRSLEARGKADQLKAHTKQLGSEVTRAVRKAKGTVAR